jgi:hypothetical protein
MKVTTVALAAAFTLTSTRTLALAQTTGTEGQTTGTEGYGSVVQPSVGSYV